ncbi:MAG: hypothetical protein ACTSO6_02010 [Promethearchaeota archaeon]
MVFKIYRSRLRKYSFVLSTVVALFLLASATPVVFNFDEVFGIGYFSIAKDYTVEYSDGYGELNMDMSLDNTLPDRYSYRLTAHLSKGSDVEIVGITFFNYTVSAKGSPIGTSVVSWSPPREQFSYGSSVLLLKDERITWSGSANVSFISNGFVQNETFDFNLGITIPMSTQDLYNMNLIEYVILFLWFMAFPVVPVILSFIIKPQFGVPLDDETQKKQKKYYDFFKKSEEESK